MSLPEISRRCVSCGAAVRAGARFCPQCGTAVSEGASSVGGSASPPEEGVTAKPEPESRGGAALKTREVYASAADGEPSKSRAAEVPTPDAKPRALEAEVDARAGDGARGVVPDTGEWSASSKTGGAEAATLFTPAAPPPTRTEDAAASEESAASEAFEDKRGRVARVREGTRARVDNTRARVGRVKGDALVALEETPDDSGMRFVAVAVALFVLFLLFLLLSVTVLR